MGLFFYQIFIGEFIVLKKRWHDEGLYLTLGFMGGILLFFYLSTKTANPVEQYRSKVRSRLRSPHKSIILKYLGYPFMLLLVFSMSYMSLVETIPTLYTSQFGKPYSSSITILNKDDIRYGRKICPGRYKVSSPEFQHNSWLKCFLHSS